MAVSTRIYESGQSRATRITAFLCRVQAAFTSSRRLRASGAITITRPRLAPQSCRMGGISTALTACLSTTVYDAIMQPVSSANAIPREAPASRSLAGNPARLREAGASRGIAFALLTGCMIASYTVVDKQAVSAVLIPPILQDWGANLGRVIVMAPLALRRREEVKAAWTRQRKAVILVALLCPLSYILVLTAMVFTPVSYVAPAREISILFAALMGAHWLQEGDVPRRVAAAAAMALGVVALAIG